MGSLTYQFGKKEFASYDYGRPKAGFLTSSRLCAEDDFLCFRGIRNSAAARLAKPQGVDPNDELVDRDQEGRGIRYDGRRCFQFFGPFF